jgi:hypothetical protein
MNWGKKKLPIYTFKNLQHKGISERALSKYDYVTEQFNNKRPELNTKFEHTDSCIEKPQILM